MYLAYFDESGHGSSTSHIAIGALVADNVEWARFTPLWQQALEENSVPYLHMREFAHSRGPYSGWNEEQRRSLMRACVGAINSVHAVAVGAAMSMDDYNALPEDAKVGFRDPFLCCFQEAVRGAAIRGMFEPESHSVDMIFSQQDEFRTKVTQLWEALAKTLDVKERMGSLTFGDMRATPALQAADLLAYELRHFYHRRATHPGTPARWPFRTIVHHQRTAFGARMLKYLPGWYLQFQAAGILKEGMDELMRCPELYWPLLQQLHPDVDPPLEPDDL